VKPSEMIPRELVLTRKELAAALKVCEKTVDRLNIPSVRLGRRRLYRIEDVKDFLREHAA
jgi:hypothetical protein